MRLQNTDLLSNSKNTNYTTGYVISIILDHIGTNNILKSEHNQIHVSYLMLDFLLLMVFYNYSNKLKQQM